MNDSYELIFLNDGSKNKSIQLIEVLALSNPYVKFIDFSPNFGRQTDIDTGLEHLIGKHVVIFDADLQDPPELILDWFKKMDENYQVVYARQKSRKGGEFFKETNCNIILSNISKY